MTNRPIQPQHGAGSATGAITLALTLLGWSSVPLFLKHFADLIDPWTSNGWRYGFSALLWAPLVILLATRRALPERIWRRALLPSAFNSVGQVLFTWAHYRIDPGLLTFGMRSQIAFVMVGAWILFPGERRVIRSPLFWGGLLLIAIGVGGTVFLGREIPRGATATGVLLAIGAGFCFACYSLSVRRQMQADHPAIAFAVISQYTALAMVALMVLFGVREGRTVPALPGAQISLLLLSALIGIALGHLFFYTSIARLGVAVTAGVLQLQPILVALASGPLFGEQLTTAQWGGGLLAIAGAVAILLAQRAVIGRSSAVRGDA